MKPTVVTQNSYIRFVIGKGLFGYKVWKEHLSNGRAISSERISRDHRKWELPTLDLVEKLMSFDNVHIRIDHAYKTLEKYVSIKDDSVTISYYRRTGTSALGEQLKEMIWQYDCTNRCFMYGGHTSLTLSHPILRKLVIAFYKATLL